MPTPSARAAESNLGGQYVNALYGLWRFAVMKERAIPLSEGETFHLRGGNEEMPKAFAARLGARVRLNHPITSIQHDAAGVTVTFTAYGYDKPQTMRADYLVNCIALPVFRRIPLGRLRPRRLRRARRSHRCRRRLHRRRQARRRLRR